MAIIEVENIAIRNEDEYRLNGVSLSVEKGALLLFLGSYESGAVELLKSIAGILEPDSGKITIDGTNIYAAKSLEEEIYRRSKTAFVFKNGGLISNLTIMQNLILPMNILYKDFSLAYKEKLIYEFMAIFNLIKILKKRPSELTQDERKLVGFLRAQLIDSPIILMDEPTANLGVENAELVYNKIEQNKRSGITQLILNHSSENFIKLADGVVVMEEGRIALTCYGDELADLDIETLIGFRNK
ncbi:MAG: ATP-binding cassette domain-containing protein [Bacteroidetes bacterium]|nr:ATP-binding cassette domain-containing protein [Bacteroidota bacterium]MBU1678454.1 ATP-binding cassette domain-containing protein [Bacteroidota bacterium]MBU2505229.1 ATP-binding cassette domain-containing protein [Bacteroidota bacterium]